MKATAARSNHHIGGTSHYIVCGRGRLSAGKSGNREFRDIVHANVARYLHARTSMLRSSILDEIIATLRGFGYQFVIRDAVSGSWRELDSKKVREKVGHAMRDAISHRKQQFRRSVTPLTHAELLREAEFAINHRRLLARQQAIFLELVRQDNARIIQRATGRHLLPDSPSTATVTPGVGAMETLGQNPSLRSNSIPSNASRFEGFTTLPTSMSTSAFPIRMMASAPVLQPRDMTGFLQLPDSQNAGPNWMNQGGS